MSDFICLYSGPPKTCFGCGEYLYFTVHVATCQRVPHHRLKGTSCERNDPVRDELGNQYCDEECLTIGSVLPPRPFFCPTCGTDDDTEHWAYCRPLPLAI